MFFGKKVTNKSLENCTILIQGRIDSECLNLWIKNHKNNNVVLSIWEDEDLSKYKIPKSWKVVVNQYPFVRFRASANLDYQLITTLKGLNSVKTYWVVKVRADEYWSNLDKIYDKSVFGINVFIKSLFGIITYEISLPGIVTYVKSLLGINL